MERFEVSQDGDEVKACGKHGEYKVRFLMVGDRRMNLGGCPQCSDEAEVEYQTRIKAQDASDAQARAEQRLKRAGIPLRFRARTLDTYRVENDGQRAALALADEFVTNWDAHSKAGTMVVFSGPPGTGKSHVAIGIGLELMARGATVIYSNTIDAIRAVRDTWRKGSERSELQVLDLFGGVDLLILDEVGMQFGTDGEQIQVFDIINRRYQDARPTILLTNLSKTGLREFLGDRSFDRLREDGKWQVFDWESWRPKMRGATA